MIEYTFIWIFSNNNTIVESKIFIMRTQQDVVINEMIKLYST